MDIFSRSQDVGDTQMVLFNMRKGAAFLLPVPQPGVRATEMEHCTAGRLWMDHWTRMKEQPIKEMRRWIRAHQSWCLLIRTLPTSAYLTARLCPDVFAPAVLCVVVLASLLLTTDMDHVYTNLILSVKLSREFNECHSSNLQKDWRIHLSKFTEAKRRWPKQS